MGVEEEEEEEVEVEVEELVGSRSRSSISTPPLVRWPDYLIFINSYFLFFAGATSINIGKTLLYTFYCCLLYSLRSVLNTNSINLHAGVMIISLFGVWYCLFLLISFRIILSTRFSFALFNEWVFLLSFCHVPSFIRKNDKLEKKIGLANSAGAYDRRLFGLFCVRFVGRKKIKRECGSLYLKWIMDAFECGWKKQFLPLWLNPCTMRPHPRCDVTTNQRPSLVTHVDVRDVW